MGRRKEAKMTVRLKITKERRKKAVRAKIKISGQKNKLTVFRSNRYILGQIIDLKTGKTLVSLGDKKWVQEKRGLKKVERAFELGKEIAQKAIKIGIKKVAFDRGSYKYHGRVKALADGAREGGLKL